MSSANAQASSHWWRLRLVALLVVLVSGTVLTLGAFAVETFERAVAPELAKRTRLIGVIVRAELQRALELGVRLDSMAGLDRYLSGTLQKFDEIDAIAVHDAAGVPVASTRRSVVDADAAAGPEAFVAQRNSYSLPIVDGNRLVGEIRIEGSAGFVRSRLSEVLLDVMTIALVAVLLALESILMLGAASVTRPLARVFHLLDAQRHGDFRHRIGPGGPSALVRVAERLNDHAQDLADRFAALPSAARARVRERLEAQLAVGRPGLLRLADVNDIRPALFLFSLSTEVAVSFLPLYARSLDRPAWLAPDLAAAAPLVAYLLAVGLLTPFAGRLARRFGARRLFLLSVPPTVLSLAALAQASHVVEITFWRGVMAVFYATATIACQEYALRASADSGSARPMGAFVAVVYGGVFCGAALGGVVAGSFGFRAALLAGAAIAVLSGALGAALMSGPAGDAARRTYDLPREARTTRPGAKLLALLLGLAVPMNVATAVFVWYLTPLMLTAAGSGPAEVARVVMLYYVAIVIVGPAATALSDGSTGPRALAIGGASLAAASLLSMSLWGGFWAAVTATAGLGVGHALMRAPVYALAQRLDPLGTAVTPLRVAERFGAIAGLGACALSLQSIGADAAMQATGILACAGLLFYLAMEAAVRARTNAGRTR
ncbi:MAG: MFS transporter [Burkholderiaceae bacterium]|nr:MFS transporter [Burkholderiaceae bacterium]